MKKRTSGIISSALTLALTLVCVSITSVSAATETVATTLFEETFNSNSYASTTTYEGKTGAWTEEDKYNNGLGVNQDGGDGKIYSNQSSGGARVFTFDSEYSGAMVLKVTADIITGASTNASKSRLDVFSDAGRITVCRLEGGHIYANTLGDTAAYNTGATYEYQHRHTVTAIIDEANEIFTLSIHDDTDDTDVLTNYVVPNYKHDKGNWAKMTSGFKGIYYYSYRNGGGGAESLFNIKVEKLEEVEVVDPNLLFEETFETSPSNGTHTYNDKAMTWTVPTGAAWNHDGDNGTAGRILCANNGSTGYSGLEWKFTFDEGYSDTMLLKVTAELDAGTTASSNNCRLDVWSDNNSAGTVARLTLCSFEGGKIYANCMGADAARDTGATYTAGHRYIITGMIDEAAQTFKLSVYDKTGDEAVLTDYNVVPYKHSKSNWAAMTSGLNGVCFVASRNTTPVYALYNIKVEKLPVPTKSGVTAVEVESSDTVHLAAYEFTVSPVDDSAYDTVRVTVNGETQTRSIPVISGSDVTFGVLLASYTYTVQELEAMEIDIDFE